MPDLALRELATEVREGAGLRQDIKPSDLGCDSGFVVLSVKLGHDTNVATNKHCAVQIRSSPRTE